MELLLGPGRRYPKKYRALRKERDWVHAAFRIVIRNMPGFTPATMVALTIADAEHLCDRLNGRCDRRLTNRGGRTATTPRRAAAGQGQRQAAGRSRAHTRS